MLTEFMKFGYLGLLGLQVYLCYRVIDKGLDKNRSLAHILLILLTFSLVAVAGGTAGYFWASKELEVAQAHVGQAEMLSKEIAATRYAHGEQMVALYKALDGVVNKLNSTTIPSERKEFRAEIADLNSVIEGREKILAQRILDLRLVFDQVAL